jgi:putative acetyltransferase
MEIRLDDLSGPEIEQFLEAHIEEMQGLSVDHGGPESNHALDIDGLRTPEITFWTVWEDGALAGCGALKELDPRCGEIKSMRTASSHRRRGVARLLVEHMLAVARARGYRAVCLETGSYEFFAPARALYEKLGFHYCGPFADYVEDPNSVFMTIALP